MGSGGQHTGEHQALPSPPHTRSLRHRRRAPTGAGEAPDSGLDLPPSATFPSLNHQACRLKIQTSQYLCTLIHPSCKGLMEESIPAGTAPCDPIIAFGRYVVSATDDGRVCFYSNQNQQLEPRPPVAIVELDVNCTITGLAAAPAGVSLVQYRSTSVKDRILMPPYFLGHCVVMSSEGDVHIIEWTDNEQGAKKLCSWDTGTCNPSCVAVRPDCTGKWRISLGYDSGCLQEWQVSIPGREMTSKEPVPSTNDENGSNEEVKRQTDTSTATKVEWKPLLRRVSPKLLFQGFFDLPIRSVSSLGTEATEEEKVSVVSENANKDILLPDLGEENDIDKTKLVDEDGKEEQANSYTEETKREKKENETEDISHDTRDYLAVCLVMNPQTVSDESLVSRPASSSQIEVIRTSPLERDWSALLEQQDQKQTHTKESTSNVALPLHDYSVWPYLGMEILDTASLPANDSDGQRRLSRRIRGLPSHGSDIICSHSGNDPFFAAALSDGTVARLRATLEDGNFCWGVQNDCDQVTLSYPAVGLAHVHLPMGDYIACCLRGGTVYLVPDSKDVEPITAILGPADAEEEDSTHYLQGFTAGNVRVDGIERSTCETELAVLLFSSAGGVLKVYSCALLAQSEEDSILNELVENGTFRFFRDLVGSLEDDDPLLGSGEWNKARDEMKKVRGKELTAETLRSPSMVYTRQVLMELSKKGNDAST